MSADIVLLVALLAFAVGLGIGWLTKGEYDAAERWGEEMAALRRLPDWDERHPASAGWRPAGTAKADGSTIYVRYRHVPTDDGGEDLL